jgi:hypothetical protein
VHYIYIYIYIYMFYKRFKSSGILCCLTESVVPGSLKHRRAFIFRVEQSNFRISLPTLSPFIVITHTYIMHPVLCAPLYFFLVCLTLKLKSLRPFRMSGTTHPMTQHHIPEGHLNFQQCYWENPKTCNSFMLDYLEYFYMKFEPF